MYSIIVKWSGWLVALVAVAALIHSWTNPRIVQAPTPEPIVQTKVEYVTRTKVVTPDGTQIECQSDCMAEAATRPVPVSTEAPSTYSVGAYIDPVRHGNIRADVGARLGNSPLEAVVGASRIDGTWAAEVGLRVRF